MFYMTICRCFTESWEYAIPTHTALPYLTIRFLVMPRAGALWMALVYLVLIQKGTVALVSLLQTCIFHNSLGVKRQTQHLSDKTEAARHPDPCRMKSCLHIRMRHCFITHTGEDFSESYLIVIKHFFITVMFEASYTYISIDCSS
jgi:hypothetical protein